MSSASTIRADRRGQTGFRIALIDLDGTLVATHHTIRECLARALRQHARPLPEESALAAVMAMGLPLPDSFLALAPDLAQAEVESCVRCYRQHYPEVDAERSQPFDGVAEALPAMRRRGVAIALVTNKGWDAAVATIARLGFADSIDHLFAARQDEPTKPDPELFLQRIAPLYGQLSPDSYLMVGDTEIDLRFARNVGMRSCWARYGYGDEDRCRALTPDYEIECFADLVEILGDPQASGSSISGSS